VRVTLGAVDHLFMPAARRAALRQRFEAEIKDVLEQAHEAA